jgi:hypothetical protein
MITRFPTLRWLGEFAFPDEADGEDAAGTRGLADTEGTSAVSATVGRMVPKPKYGSRPGSPLSLAVVINRLITLAAFS